MEKNVSIVSKDVSSVPMNLNATLVIKVIIMSQNLCNAGDVWNGHALIVHIIKIVMRPKNSVKSVKKVHS